MNLRRNITIFEGPDGSGKTTLAKKYAKETDAKYVHFNADMGVTTGLGRRYVESMLPALWGYQNVVFDRCWLSEYPYRKAFHGGELRLDKIQIRMLERLALTCRPVVVKCQPPWVNVINSFDGRTEDEMLDNAEQLKEVYDLYKTQTQGLPEVGMDYTKHNYSWMWSEIHERRAPQVAHLTCATTAGVIGAPQYVIKGRVLEPTNNDSVFRWPEGSLFNAQSKYVTAYLDWKNIPENEIMWYTDQDKVYAASCTVIDIDPIIKEWDHYAAGKTEALCVPI